MIKPMECPRCHGNMIHAGTAMIWKGFKLFKKIIIAIDGRDEEFWCENCGHTGIWMRSFSIKSCIRKFNRWARRELRRMKKEGEKK